jgi:ABC-type lipoprotein export system ATPase subunit
LPLALIELTDVCKTYDLGEVKVEALKGATLQIERGEYIALIGPSGSGKSTLMNTLGCLDRPTSGSYKLAGDEVATMSRDERAVIRNQRIGFVFQNFNLLARTTALENVELPLLYSKGISARERRQRAVDKLKLVGLADRLDHHPSQLSGGQQQLVGVARAVVASPGLILADEPTGNLHSDQAREIMELFKKLNNGGTTIIQVTHSEANAQFGNRVIKLRDGWIVQ